MRAPQGLAEVLTDGDQNGRRDGCYSVPVTWEGWVTIAVYVVVLTGGVIVVHGADGRLALVLLLTGGLLLVIRGRMTAPMRWGR